MKVLLIATTILLFSLGAHSQLDSSIVPIRVSYFEAGSTASATILKWKTACFLDYASFEIQESADGINYRTINRFTADRLRCEQPFDYTVTTIIPGRVLYRLNVTDIAGKTYHSKIIAVFSEGKGFAVNTFAPTVVNTSVLISISAAVNENVLLSVVNMQGSIVKQQALAIPKGASTHQLSMEELQTGKYQALFQRQGGEKTVISFVKQ